MNGAAALLDSMTRTAWSRMMSSNGTSHHFLLCRRKAQNSTRMFSLPLSRAARSNSLAGLVSITLSLELTEVAAHTFRPWLGFPVTGGACVSSQTQGIAPGQPQDQAQRSEHAVVQKRQ